MKKHLIIFCLLIVAAGSYKKSLLETDQPEGAIKTAVTEVSAGKPILPEVAVGQFDGSGEYLEVRSAAASAEPSEAQPATGMAGDQATLAWRVREGTYHGVPLNGLAVVAVIFRNGLPGIGEKASTRTTFLVDASANEAQQAALVAMARSFAGDTIQEVVAVKPVKIDMNVCRGCAAGYASLKADTIVIRTRRVLDSDKSDGKPETPHPSTLAKVYFQYPALALEHTYSGSDFEGKPVQFSSTDLCSTAVGGF